ncbi:MAG: hypothetical protein ACP5I1_02875 [Candidatus Hinthialibacter sp.]
MKLFFEEGRLMDQSDEERVRRVRGGCIMMDWRQHAASPFD